MRDYLKLIKRKIFNKLKQMKYVNIRLSFDEVDKRCRRVLNGAPEIVPLSTMKRQG